MRRRILLPALAVVALGATAAATSAASRPEGLTPARTRIDFTLVLKLRQAALARYAEGLFDPGSPLYGRYLSPAESGRRFGLSDRGLVALGGRLRSLGFRVTATSKARTAVGVRGTAGLVDRTFRIRLVDAVDGTGRVYHRPDRAPKLPRSLAHWAEAVAGLDRTPVQQAADATAVDVSPFGPGDTRTFYDLKPLLQRGVDGTGQTIALLSIDHLDKGNLSTFVRHYGLPKKPVITRTVGAGNNDRASFESDQDAEIIRSVAPGAQIVDYQVGGSVHDWGDAINQVVDEGRARIVSGSFGTCDGTNADAAFNKDLVIEPGDRSYVEGALATAAMAGVSFFFSTGDYGGHDCSKWVRQDVFLSTHFPAGAPFAVAVGGTVAIPSADGTLDEQAWGEPLSNLGGGGGLNPFDKKPPWQKAVRIPGSNGYRQLPDVSALAGTPYWSVWTTFHDGTHGWADGNGTSAATPFWAAAMLLVQQYMTKQHAGPVCFAAPLLYAVAKKTPSAFFDITSGTNLGWSAQKGWDFATGWGTPNVWNLARGAVAWRAKHPLPGGGNACKSQVPS